MICFVCAACVCVCVYKALALGCVERRAVKREEAKTDVLYAHTKNYKQSPPGQNTHTHFLVGERRTHVPNPAQIGCDFGLLASSRQLDLKQAIKTIPKILWAF